MNFLGDKLVEMTEKYTTAEIIDEDSNNKITH